MKNAPEVSMDEGTDAAWTRFRRRLADRLAALGIGDCVLVELEGDDEADDRCTPYVQASSDDGLHALAEVSATVTCSRSTGSTRRHVVGSASWAGRGRQRARRAATTRSSSCCLEPTRSQ